MQQIRFATAMAGLAALCCSVLLANCADGEADEGDDDLDTGSGTDLDTDVDTDADTDTDTETDGDCDPPSGVGDWGGVCDPQDPDCPADTWCVTIDGMDLSHGYCTPLCCEGDHSYCEDIGSGDEQCLVSNIQTDEWWCVVLCTSNEDCVDGTVCLQAGDTEYFICYWGEDTDTDTDTGSENCPDDEVAACNEAYGACQLDCGSDTDSYDECVAACFETYCNCLEILGCDLAEYDCS